MIRVYLNPEIGFMSRAVDFNPSQKIRVKVLAVSMGKAS